MTDRFPLRSITPEEFEDYNAVLHTAFGEDRTAEYTDLYRSIVEYDRTVAAFDGDRIVATAGVDSFELTVPGGTVPMGGVTAVGVLPSHRRKGLLRRMMLRMFDDSRERGEPLAGLLASESIIYPRFGYGLATEQASLQIDTGRARLAADVPRLDVELVSLPDGPRRLAPIYDRCRRQRAGLLDVSDARWGWVETDPESGRDGAGPRQVAVAGDRAFAVYRLKGDWAGGLANHEIRLEFLFATDSEAYLGMWQWLFELDLAGRLTAHERPVDEPVQLALADPRQLQRRITDAMWLAVLDVPAALQSRLYRSPGELVFEVTGAFAAGVDGTYRLVVDDDGQAACERGSGSVDVVLPAAALGAVYLGGTQFGRLASAGVVGEHTVGSVARADAVFGSTPAPWCPFEF